MQHKVAPKDIPQGSVPLYLIAYMFALRVSYGEATEYECSSMESFFNLVNAFGDWDLMITDSMG